MENKKQIRKKEYMSNCILIFLFLFCIGCRKPTAQNEIISSKESTSISCIDTIKIRQSVKNDTVKTDSTINKVLLLRNPESIKYFYSDYKNLLCIENDIRAHPFVIFTNINNTQYLLAFKYEGDLQNQFSCFEIGYLKNDNFSGLKNYITKYNNFFTESGIKLGMSLPDLILIKGQNYTTKKTGEDNLIIYRENAQSSNFVSRYFMDEYIMEYTIRDNKIIKIFFGFEYP